MKRCCINMINLQNSFKEVTLPNLYNKYSSILTLSDIPLFLLDVDGSILSELIPSPIFCTHVCHQNSGKACTDYLSKIESKSEGAFQCKHGLENIILPIIVNEEVLGYVAGLQTYQSEYEYKKH